MVVDCLAPGWKGEVTRKGARMSWYWVGFAIGIYMTWGGATKSSAKPYFFLHARASLLWEQQAHIFLMISGIAVSLVMLFLALTR